MAAQPGQPLGLVPVGAVLACGALLGGIVVHLRAVRGSSSSRSTRKPTLWLLGSVGVGLGLAIGSAHVARLHPSVLSEVVEGSRVVQVVARVVGDPRSYQPPEAFGRPSALTWSAEARVQELTVRGRTFTLSAPVVLRGSQASSLRYGSVVALTGRAQKPYSPQTHAMELRLLGAIQVRAPPGRIAAKTTSTREAFASVCTGIPDDAAALLMGLAVGDESTLSPELDRAMIRSGLSHLTAVSGSNTSLVCGLALALVAGLGLSWRIRVMASLLVLAGYVELVRPQPSVLRAAAMGVVGLIALSAGGRRRGPPALLASALVLLVWLPQFAVSIGFALSFAATAGLLVIGPALADGLARWRATRRFPEPLRLAFAVAAAAHVATLPLAVLMGNGASLVALPANVLVAPLVPVATVLGLVAALLASPFPAVAGVLAHVAAPATGAIAWVAHTAAAAPLGVVPVPDGALGAVGTAVLLALLAWSARAGWRPWCDRRTFAAVIAAALLLSAVRIGLDGRWPRNGWIVLACDVGQGDALLVRPPGSTDALLVDAGPDGAALSACLADAGVRRVTVLITHFHADHIDGLATVLGHWPVEELVTTFVPEPREGAALVADLARTRGVPVRQVRNGDRLTLVGMPLTVLWPARRVAESPANNASVVCLVSVPTGSGPLRILLTGDVEPEAQAALMAQGPPAVDIVKVPHHGSVHQDPGFAAWTGARIALVSVGRDNDYGHPSAQTLDAYRRRGALVGRTDTEGALAVVMSGDQPALVVQR